MKGVWSALRVRLQVKNVINSKEWSRHYAFLNFTFEPPPTGYEPYVPPFYLKYQNLWFRFRNSNVYSLLCQDNITNIWFPRSNTIITRLFPDYIPIVWIAALLEEHCLYLISAATSDIIHIPINYSAQSQIFTFIISSHSLLIFAYRYNHELWGFRVMFFSLNLIALTTATGWKMTSILVQKSAFDTFICD